MDTHTWILGSILSLWYNIYTTPKEDYKELGMTVVLFLCLFLFLMNWFGLVVSIAADVVSIKEKLNK